MEQEKICDSMLRDAHSLLDRAEELAAQNKELRKREQDLLEKIKNAGGFKVSTPSWIEYDDTDPEKRPSDGELVVVQVGNCQPYMLTYLKGCRVQINKWFRLPE